MDKEKSPGHGGSLPPSSGRYSAFAPNGSGLIMKPESSASSAFPPLGPGSSSETGLFGNLPDSSRFSHDISCMPDNPPKNLGHRRARSEILALPDDFSFDSDLGVVGGADGPSFSDETEEDLFSMYLDMDKFNSCSATSSFEVGEPSESAKLSEPTQTGLMNVATSSAETLAAGSGEKPRIRHQHSQSMDGSSTIKPEILMSGTEEMSTAESKKAMATAKLAELALIDPKRAKRVWANRQSAARSKERKMRYIAELERKVQTLQTEATSLSAQLTLLQRDTNGLTAENNELKLRLQTIEQQVHLQDALNDALKEEIQHLKVLTGQVIPNSAAMMNYASFGSNQQYYANNQTMQTLLAAQQFQQLQINSQQQQQHQFHQHQLHQQQQKLQHQDPQRSSIGGDSRRSMQKESASSDVNPSVSRT